MKLKAQIKYYLIYALIFLFGASFASGLFFAYRMTLFTPLTENVTASLRLGDYASLAARLLGPLLLTFLSAFTIYACAVAATASLFVGMLCGQLFMMYCLSGLNPFTHLAVLVFLLAFGVVYTMLSTQTALYRSTLKTAAPDPTILLKAPRTRSLFHTFLSASLVIISFSCAVYFLAVYFPL